jgi:hypothetical protein
VLNVVYFRDQMVAVLVLDVFCSVYRDRQLVRALVDTDLYIDVQMYELLYSMYIYLV